MNHFSRGGLIWASFLTTLLNNTTQAQGGPPMVTDDPGTPGHGHWEINLASIASRSAAMRGLTLPDADINYGWGESLQLKADIPLVLGQTNGNSSHFNFGTGNFGVKWRFLDEETNGVSISTYPQYATHLNTFSAQQGLALVGSQIFLPLEFAGHWNAWTWDSEIGRSFFSAKNMNNWRLGFLVGHDCGSKDIQCMAEVNQTINSTDNSRQTLFNIGIHWKIDESHTLLAASGRSFGTPSPYQDQFISLIYVGMQLSY